MALSTARKMIASALRLIGQLEADLRLEPHRAMSGGQAVKRCQARPVSRLEPCRLPGPLAPGGEAHTEEQAAGHLHGPAGQGGGRGRGGLPAGSSPAGLLHLLEHQAPLSAVRPAALATDELLGSGCFGCCCCCCAAVSVDRWCSCIRCVHRHQAVSTSCVHPQSVNRTSMQTALMAARPSPDSRAASDARQPAGTTSLGRIWLTS